MEHLTENKAEYMLANDPVITEALRKKICRAINRLDDGIIQEIVMDRISSDLENSYYEGGLSKEISKMILEKITISIGLK